MEGELERQKIKGIQTADFNITSRREVGIYRLFRRRVSQKGIKYGIAYIILENNKKMKPLDFRNINLD